jgi:hypothetical protein
MPFRSRFIVAPALRECEAMVDTWLQLNLTGAACALE